MSGQGQEAVPENGPPVGPGATGAGEGKGIEFERKADETRLTL